MANGDPKPAAKAKGEKPVKLTPQKAAARLADQVLPELEARMREEGAGAPEGAQAGLAELGGKLRKALPQIIAGLMELGAIAADGQLSADEVRDLAGKLFEFIRARRAGTA